MNKHDLKTDPLIYDAVMLNVKRVEVRKDDREPKFAEGDVLNLKKTKFTGSEMASGSPLIYTGYSCRRIVTHCLRGEEYGIKEGYVALSIRPLTKQEKESGLYA